MGRPRRRRRLSLVPVVFLILLRYSDAASSGASRSPYSILDVRKDASQAAIKQQYHNLCLKYHPDKNVNSPEKTRLDYEKRFKEVQKAYNLIGDSVARKQYDQQEKLKRYFTGNSAASRYANNNHFRKGQTYAFRFHRTAVRENLWGPLFAGANKEKAKFVQKVKVPLEVLHDGEPSFEIVLRSGLWSRCVAAFRGGSAAIRLLQAATIALPFARIAKRVALCVFFYSFKCTLPEPSQTVFAVDIQAGFKAGTKVKFSRVDMEVEFQLEEGNHPLYYREGDDLYTSMQINRKQASKGCSVDVPILRNNAPGETTTFRVKLDAPISHGQTIKIPDKGWLNRRTGKRGQLFIRVEVLKRVKGNSI